MNTHTLGYAHTHIHDTDMPIKNGVTGFHGAMRLTDRAEVLTCSQTTGKKMERKRRGQRERERGRGSIEKKQRRCRIREIYHTQAADHF